MATQNRVCFERLTQEFDTLFDYTSREVSKLNLLNVSIIHSKYDISIDQIGHIINNIVQEY